ncbi:MAG TPA: hypothetical protein VHK88_08845, partial [Aquihabitans sp.]|nr:hypothetical protein [Aquihabitans sp.]
MPRTAPPTTGGRGGAGHRTRRRGALAALAVAVALGALGACGPSDGGSGAIDAGRGEATEVAAEDAAVERVAAFRCPKRALEAGAARPGPAGGD